MRLETVLHNRLGAEEALSSAQTASECVAITRRTPQQRNAAGECAVGCVEIAQRK